MFLRLGLIESSFCTITSKNAGKKQENVNRVLSRAQRLNEGHAGGGGPCPGLWSLSRCSGFARVGGWTITRGGAATRIDRGPFVGLRDICQRLMQSRLRIPISVETRWYLLQGLMEGPTMGADVKMPGDGQHVNQIAEPPLEKLSSGLGADQKREDGCPGRGPDDQTRPDDGDRT